MVDYSMGRYVVKTADGGFIGRIDGDEFVRNGTSLMYRIDGDEFYEAGGRLIGNIVDAVVRTRYGEAMFTIEAD